MGLFSSCVQAIAIDNSPMYTWHINKTGTEEYVDIGYKIINDTTTCFDMMVSDKSAYTSAIASKDLKRSITSVPVASIKGDFSLEKTSIDLSKSSLNSKQQFCVYYPKGFQDGMSFKIGWESIIVDSTAKADATANPSKDNIVMDSTGKLHLVYEDSDSDVQYCKSASPYTTWNCSEVTATSVYIGGMGLLINSTDGLMVYYSVTSTRAKTSSNYGVSWGAEFVLGATYGTTYTSSCTVRTLHTGQTDFVECIHPTDAGGFSYSNETSWDTGVYKDYTSSTYLASCTNDTNLFVFQTDESTDDLVMIRKNATGWGAFVVIDSDLGAVNTNSVGVSCDIEGDHIYVTTSDTSDLYLYEAMVQNINSWNSSSVDTSNSYWPNIAVSPLGRVDIMYFDGTSTVTSSTDMYLSNRSATTKAWTVRTVLSLDSGLASIADTYQPSANRMTDTVHYVFSNYSSRVAYSNYTIPYTVADTTKPQWSVGGIPANETWEYWSERVLADFNATDNIGITNWDANDTTNFNISQITGMLENKTSLAKGTYYIQVNVSDAAGNKNTTMFKAIVSDTKAPRMDIPANKTLTYGITMLSEFFNATDPSNLSTQWHINGTAKFNMTTTAYVGNLKNKTLLAVGTYYINVSIRDLQTNQNSTRFKVTVGACVANWVNTSKTAWRSITACQVNDSITQSRNWTKYDTNFCIGSNNVTYTNTSNLSCNYCTATLDNTSWSKWTNVSCESVYHQNQSSDAEQFNDNYDTCCKLTGIGTDCIANTTVYRYSVNMSDYTLCDYGGMSVEIIDPVNDSTFSTSSVSLNFTYNFTADVCSYELDVNGTDISLGSGGFIGMCYQESANVSNQGGLDGTCGLIYTGEYGSSGTWSNINKTSDGNWSNFGGEAGATPASRYINYSKPSSAIAAMWYGKDDSVTSNKTIIASCFDYNPSKLLLRVESENNMVTDYINWTCYNGSWVQLYYDEESAYTLYEEAIWWNISNSAYISNTTITTLPTGWHNVSVSCNNTYGYTATDLNEFYISLTDTCTCPGLYHNWNVNNADYCNITTNCNLGNGTFSWFGESGLTRLYAHINATNVTPTSGKLWVMNNSAKIWGYWTYP